MRPRTAGSRTEGELLQCLQDPSRRYRRDRGNDLRPGSAVRSHGDAPSRQFLESQFLESLNVAPRLDSRLEYVSRMLRAGLIFSQIDPLAG